MKDKVLMKEIQCNQLPPSNWLVSQRMAQDEYTAVACVGSALMRGSPMLLTISL